MIGPSNSIVGAVLALAAGGAVIDAVQPTPPVMIEALAYDPVSDAVTYQPVARGHGAGDPLRATWAAYVISTDGIGSEVVCRGGDVGRYTARHEPLRWTLDYLVGQPGCAASLLPGSYDLTVQIIPLDGHATQRSTTFEVVK
jgi:hypothetical protein